LRFLVCIFINDLETERITKKAEFVQALSKSLAYSPLAVERAIEDFREWKAIDDLLAARVKTAEELNSLGELAKPAPPAAIKGVGSGKPHPG
jgi:hypothetical protein